MPDTRWPTPPIDLVRVSAKNAIDDSALTNAIASTLGQIQSTMDLVVSPYVGDVIPDLLRDETANAETLFARSDSSNPVISAAKKLRGLVFVNYSTTLLYLQIHGVSPAPAANVKPQFPPIPVQQYQAVFGDQALLGYDGFGFNACTLRVSTSLSTYTPTGATPDLWALIARFK